jgi:hypothetical protein
MRAPRLLTGLLHLARAGPDLPADLWRLRTMKSWINCCALGALLLATYPCARADVARIKEPEHKGGVSVSMHIEPNYKATEARLLIPRSIWQDMKAQLDANDSATTTASARFHSLNGAQTVAAGCFLSLAFAFGGVWLVRARKGSGWRRAALGLLLVVLGGASVAGIAYANAGPPPVARSLTSKILVPGAQPYGVYGQVKVEVVDDRSQITLVLPVGKDNNNEQE